jgi:2-C-methyl-D-erythritol 2,4-cyclodiphosphate synthase
LGAAGLKDIGSFFPDNDPKYKDIDSLKLLEITMEKLKEANWKIGNIDCNIIIQKPKMAAHIPQMKLNIAKVLNIETSQIGIKAKTSENIGFIGREEGASAQAVCLIYKA